MLERCQPTRRRRCLLEPLEPRLVLDSTVVLNEIMYNPAGSDESLEFIELYNQMAVDMDISAWRLSDGVEFGFAEGTVVPGGGYLVVAKNPAALTAVSGQAPALGPYMGQLANNGEVIELRDRNDRLMDSIEYGDDGPWPVAPDGSGTSLAKVDPITTSAPARHWTSSVIVGGSPGMLNFPEANVEKSFVNIVPLDATWTYEASDVFPGDAWPTADFADDDWPSGKAPFFAGDAQLDGPAVERVMGVTVTASSELAGFDRRAVYLVDGSGLAGDAHGTTPDGSMWLSQGTFGGGRPDRDPEITFDLELVRNVTQMKLWNYNEDLPNRPELLGRGVSSADILVAGEDGVFHVLIANRQFDKAPGTQADFSQTIDLGGVEARFVKLDIHDNFPGGDNDFVGLSEVQFFAQPDPFLTELSLGPTTFYYRTEFQFSGDPRTAELLLNNIVDDGAVFYLNGTEVHRQNLPAGAVDPTTLAPSAVSSASVSEVIQLSAKPLVRGRNVLGVEVHQAEAADSDMVFAAELNALAVLPQPGYVTTLVPLDDTWRFEATSTDLGTDWRETNFDDSSWEGGQGATLVGFWPLDDNAEAAVGTDGSLVNGPRFSADRKGVPDSALRFRGNRQQRVDIAGGGGLDGANAGTISMWVRWSGTQDADCCGGTAGSVLSRQANGQFSDNIITLDNP